MVGARGGTRELTLGRSRAGRARARARARRAAATWPSSTPRRGAASRSRSTTAASSARRAAASAAPACAWCRATRPTTATWTASPRRTCCAWRARCPRPCAATPRAPGGAARGESRHPAIAVASPPEDVEAARKAELLRACDERARAAGRRGRRRRGSATPSRAARWRSSARTAAPRPTTARASGSARRWWRAATAAWRPAATRAAATPAGSCSRTTPRRWPTRPRGGRSRCSTPWTRPPGRLPVVVGNGFGGVLLHEAVGHGLEADAVQKDASVYAGRLGEQLAADVRHRLRRRQPPERVGERGHRRRGHAHAPDDGDRGRAGSPPTSTTCCAPRKDGVESTGNGRRESFRHLPIPRMTNTFFAPGDATPGRPDRGRGARPLRGLVRRRPGGARHRRLRVRRVRGLPDRGRQGDGAGARGATLVGNGLEALRAIDGIAGDLEIATGYCGKGGQTVPAGVGPAARAHPRADRGRHGGVNLERRRRGARVEAALAAGATRRRGVGRGVDQPARARVRGRGREPQRRRRARRRRARVRGHPRGLRLRHRPLGGRRGGDRARRPRGRRGGRRGRVRGPARRARQLRRGRPRLAGARRLVHRADRRARARGRARGPRARGRHPGRELGLLGRRRLGRARQLARVRGLLQRHRRRGRTPPRSPARART